MGQPPLHCAMVPSGRSVSLGVTRSVAPGGTPPTVTEGKPAKLRPKSSSATPGAPGMGAGGSASGSVSITATASKALRRSVPLGAAGLQSTAGAQATRGLLAGSKPGASQPGVARDSLPSSPAYWCVKVTAPPSVPRHAPALAALVLAAATTAPSAKPTSSCA
jgi:hypothetical protein